jgi:type I restriction enzyme M protein
MKKGGRSTGKPSSDSPVSQNSNNTKLQPKRDGKGNIWSHIRKKWLVETPEEKVRQEYVCTLVNEYGFNLNQMDEEISAPGRGSGRARADILIWRTSVSKDKGEHALIVIECKSDNVTINLKDYNQGANYAQYEHAAFFVTHNNHETRFWKVDASRRMPNYDEIENIPHADATDKDIQELLDKLKVFKEDEFADQLHLCHNVIRNREKKDPAAAFDEIAKILFVKVWVEREMRRRRESTNLFTAEFLETQYGPDPLNRLFADTKTAYKDDRIFDKDEEINLKPATGSEVVKLLERYNLSDTKEDVKGIAFERFLGRTFRGEIGQFFTPRSIVEFMVRMVGPKEGDIICDPASGSGGFLIRFFEIVRESISQDIDAKYKKYKEEIEHKNISAEKKAKLLLGKHNELQQEIDPVRRGSRAWTLANRCIFGCDANDRMARTSKMNMIMHGDGHTGVHHHDGFINVNGIFRGRFDIVLTNPPFGANVEPSDIIHESDVAIVDEDDEKRYIEEYGDRYVEEQSWVRAAVKKPISSLFDLPKSGNTKTEILFIERCLSLLKPGGRLGIVLPEGILNNPSLAYVREFCEDRAYIRAVVSLPQETFFSSGASVKASLLFMQKFTEKEKADFDKKKAAAENEIRAKHKPEMDRETALLEAEVDAAKKAKDTDSRKKAQDNLRAFQRQMEERILSETRALLKERFPYHIFLYDAEKVGITATGESDQNELYPTAGKLLGNEKTCLELYREFRQYPDTFVVKGAEK